MREQAPLRFIAGSGRSGTTWVVDSIAAANGLRTVFEPLNPFTSEIGAAHAHRYLTRDDDAPDLQAMFARAADGDLRTLWTHYRIVKTLLRPHRQYFRSLRGIKRWVTEWHKAARTLARKPAQLSIRETVVKCVRANLMLEWLSARFEARVVVLVRHPGAVVESQLRAVNGGWNPHPVLERYRRDPRLLSGPLSSLSPLFDRELSKAEALALVWCAQNLVPLRQAAAGGYTVVLYEELLERPDSEWPRVAGGLGLARVPERRMLEAPSQQASANWEATSQTPGYAKAYGRWRDCLDAATSIQMQRVLDEAGVSFYRMDEARPDAEELRRFCGLADATSDVDANLRSMVVR